MSAIGSEVPPIEDQLRRDDKWFLGGGRVALWAPEWPLWLEHPGFWDHACYYDAPVEPAFAVTFLEADGSVIPLKYENRTWVPSHLTQAYTGEGLEIMERRALLPDDVLISDFYITNPGATERLVHVVLWTCQERSGRAEGREVDLCEARDKALLLRQRRYASSDGGEAPKLNLEFHMAYGASVPLKSRSIHLSEGGPNHPRWELTPFFETFNQGLDGDAKFDAGVSKGGLLYAAQHYELLIPSGETVDLIAACAMAESEKEALENLKTAVRSTDPIEISVDNWEAWFRSAPEFRCSDPYLETYYWYRWYGLKLNAVNARSERLAHPCVFEGINQGWFRHAISYSAQVHMLECKWRYDPQLAMGSLRNFIANQREDGSFPGCILTGEAESPGGFYHANWGKGVRELLAIHKSEEFLKEAYSALCRYADYLLRERDPEGSHLFDVVNQGETGQEYMARYLQARPDADEWGEFRLKGVDATVYAYELLRCLEEMAGKLVAPDDAVKWRDHADKTRDAVRATLWDDERGFFMDALPGSGERGSALSAVGFYPFLTDIATPEHLRALDEHLLNEGEFWTAWPVPSTAASDPSYSATGEWKGKRMSCPWNGRAWLMTNSHVADALAHAAQRLDPRLKPQAAELIRKTVEMTFLNRDPRHPTSYEYYNPETGQPPLFRGTDDYMHSYLADLILKYAAGVQIEDGMLVVDPLPFGLDRFIADHIPAGGRWVRVTYREEEGLIVFVDGEIVAESAELKRIEIALS